jgi:hypothetical protein
LGFLALGPSDYALFESMRAAQRDTSRVPQPLRYFMRVENVVKGRLKCGAAR